MIHLGVIVTGCVVVESGLRILQRKTLADAACIVDSLVNPVPDAATGNTCTCLDEIPVFLQVTHCLTHGMSILTDEVRLVVEAIHLLLHYLDSWIHV